MQICRNVRLAHLYPRCPLVNMILTGQSVAVDGEQRDLFKRFWWVFPFLFTALAIVIWFLGEGRSAVVAAHAPLAAPRTSFSALHASGTVYSSRELSPPASARLFR